MSMTKVDYELIATSLKECRELCLASPLPVRSKADVLKQTAYHLAYDLEANNPKFNRDKFLEACGIE